MSYYQPHQWQQQQQQQPAQQGYAAAPQPQAQSPFVQQQVQHNASAYPQQQSPAPAQQQNYSYQTPRQPQQQNWAYQQGQPALPTQQQPNQQVMYPQQAHNQQQYSSQPPVAPPQSFAATRQPSVLPPPGPSMGTRGNLVEIGATWNSTPPEARAAIVNMMFGKVAGGATSDEVSSIIRALETYSDRALDTAESDTSDRSRKLKNREKKRLMPNFVAIVEAVTALRDNRT